MAAEGVSVASFLLARRAARRGVASHAAEPASCCKAVGEVGEGAPIGSQEKLFAQKFLDQQGGEAK